MKVKLLKPRMPGKPGESEFIQVDMPMSSTFEDLYRIYEKDYPYTVLAVKVDNKLEPLVHEIEENCTVEFLDMRSQAANLIYQHSLSLIYLKAVEETLGRAITDIENSLNKGLYTEIKCEEPVTEEQIRAVEARMWEIVEEDIPFVEKIVGREEALQLLEAADLDEKKKMLESLPHLHRVKFYSLDDFRNFFYGFMVPSTGYVKYFELKKYRRGVLLRFPHTSDPNHIPPYVDEKKMYSAFSEAKRWRRLLDISYVTDLNNMIHRHEMREIIQLSEALHEKKIVEIATDIEKYKKRIVLIAGPSSSGKTTFARRLCIQLRVIGLKPLYLGTDDYFVDRALTPLDEFGEKDFENLGALDIDLFNNDMNNLLAGNPVDLPEYDFIDGVKKFGHRITSIDSSQPIVIEGIHALNSMLTSHIDDKNKYKIYISPLTQLSIDNHNRIPTTDARMLRRMVRDHNYRGHSAQSTIANWPKVRAGEDINIFPYSGDADVFFNSAHIYELAILKRYATPLLEAITRDEPEYAEAVRMLKFLEFFEPFEEDEIIMNNSIIREFIGGSVFV